MAAFFRSRFVSIYGVSTLATCLIFAAIGWGLGVSVLPTMIVLTLLEITFSLDNAVVNAGILRYMNHFWRRMFMSVGIIIAVFGMRLVLPIVLVMLTAGLNVGQVLDLTLNHPLEYAARLKEAHPVIAGFGGMFLLMIFVDYILDQTVSVFKKPARSIFGASEKFAGVFLASFALAIVYYFSPSHHQEGILIAGISGISVFMGVHWLSAWFAKKETSVVSHKVGVGTGGLISFLYLELIDASFSFDSVIGAFAITSNFVIIAAGLGAGAVWVRSLTIDLVERNAFQQYRYLNFGAYLAIGSLSALLLTSINVELPDVLTGGLGLSIIIISFLASVVHNRLEVKSGASAHKA